MPDMSKEQLLRYAEQRKLRRVLILTALPLEKDAVRPHVDELATIQGRQGRIYTCGEFNGLSDDWLAIITTTSAGNLAAQLAAANAIIEFEPVELIIFVGVAGSRKSESPIGSVVVSNRLYNPYSGKHDEEQGFTSRPKPEPVEERLIHMAENVASDLDWVSRIRDPRRTKLPPTDGPLYPEPFPPNAKVAPIVSVEAVSADPNSDLEKTIKRHCGDAVAVEMEGYGAASAARAENIPFIAVRGISDMCGGEKNPEKDALHQPIAAAHAAAFAFELLTLWGRLQTAKPMPAISPTSETRDNAASATSRVEDQHGTADAPVHQSEFVFSFEGRVPDFPSERVDKIVATLKEITEDRELAFVGLEEGSIHIIVQADPKLIDKVDLVSARKKLSEECAVTLTGVASLEQYRNAIDHKLELLTCSQGLLDWPTELPDGTKLQRPELAALLKVIEENNSSTTAVLGLPGSGKSALLSSLALILHSAGTPILAIKADLLRTDVSNESDLQSELSLSLPPSATIEKLALSGPIILIIDQLDALAGYVDLKTGRLSVLLNIVRKLSGRDNVHIVMSARQFEYEHDARLRTIKADCITLALPPWSSVQEVLQRNGVMAAGWPADAQDVLRTPQALATYLRLRKNDDVQPFRNYQLLLDQTWREKILERPDGARLAALVSDIAEEMAAKESLWLPAVRYEDRIEDLNSLVAANIITDPEGSRSRIGFSHQTVFDHALARAFARGHNKLAEFVLERQTSLFIRPKLWAALTYLRGVDPSSYEGELKQLWAVKSLRRHLRLMLMEFIGQQSEPTQIEISLLDEALSSSNRIAALGTLVGSSGWFKTFSDTHIAAAMAEPNEARIAMRILMPAWSFDANKVVSLITCQWRDWPEFDDLLWMTLQECSEWTSEHVELAALVLRRSVISPFAFDHLISTIGLSQPEHALKLVQVRLEKRLAEAKLEASRRSQLRPPTEGNRTDNLGWYMSNSPAQPITEALEDTQGWESLEALGKANPKLFLAHVWPWFVDALSALAPYSDEGRLGYPISYGVDFRFDGEHSLGLPEAPILGALAATAAELAKQKSEFLDWFGNAQLVLLRPVQRLLAFAIAHAPEHYADLTYRFLIGDNNRFILGSSEDYAATTKSLIRSVSSSWTNECITAFAEEVRNFSPKNPEDFDAKSRQSFLQIVRRIKLDLLLALPGDRLSDVITRYIAEESRRFPDAKVGSVSYGPEWIGSPIKAQSLGKASDDDILNAFKEVPDASGWDHPKQWMKGGNIQLSREFAEFAKNNIARAIRIIDRFEPTFGTRASGHAIEAMSGEAEPAALLTLMEELNARGFAGPEFYGDLARAIEKLVERKAEIPDTTIDMLKSWLQSPSERPSVESSDDTAADEIVDDEAISTEELSSKDEATSTLWGGDSFGVLPHGNFPILEAVTRILLSRKKSDELVELYAEHLHNEEDEKVWAALLRYFQYIYPSDPKILGEFIKTLFAKYPTLVASRHSGVMLAYLRWRLPEIVQSVMEIWKATQTRSSAQAYGEMAALVAITQPEILWGSEFLEQILETPELTAARVGAARTAANVWNEPKFRLPASRLLQRLMPHADLRTWAAVFDLFRLVDEITADPAWIEFLEVLADNMHNAGRISSTFVVDRLQTLLPFQAQLVGRIAKQLVDSWRDELGDFRTGIALTGSELVDLAITLHRLGDDTRELGTNLFEDLLEVSAYSARETLDEIDSRFRENARPSRPRLPRRVRKNKRAT